MGINGQNQMFALVFGLLPETSYALSKVLQQMYMLSIHLFSSGPQNRFLQRNFPFLTVSLFFFSS